VPEENDGNLLVDGLLLHDGPPPAVRRRAGAVLFGAARAARSNVERGPNPLEQADIVASALELVKRLPEWRRADERQRQRRPAAREDEGERQMR